MVHNACEELVRYCCKEEAEAMMNAKGLVRGKNGSKGAKWIAESGSEYEKSLAKAWKNAKKNSPHEFKVTIKVQKGTTQWLKDNGIMHEIIGAEKGVMNKVILKTTERGAMGVGVDLIEEFNKRVTGISKAKYR